jgi:hypothetical protein
MSILKGRQKEYSPLLKKGSDDYDRLQTRIGSIHDRQSENAKTG